MALLRRHITERLLDALSDTPVVILHGARQTGKSTLARGLTEREFPAEYLTLDDLGSVAAARRDPIGFIAGIKGNAVIDEVQRVPELIPAIKAAVDADRRPGRFLLTGSASASSVANAASMLAGRAEMLTLWPFSQGELSGVRETFIDDVFAGRLPRSRRKMSGTAGGSSDELQDRVLTGGYPEMFQRTRPERRRAWFASYLNAIVQREVREVANIAGLSEFPRLFEVLAARAGGLVNYADIARDAGLNQVTLKRYMALLEAVFLITLVRPWHSTRLKRAIKSPKLYFNDSGILAHILDLTTGRARAESRAWGSLLENFVVMELEKQRTWSSTPVSLYHFRDYQNMEVDVVLESAGGRAVAGIEVKSGATVGPDDFKGLRKLAEATGTRFQAGFVLYTGKDVIPFSERLHAIPLGSLWE